jgi:hypothetical protein
MTCAYVDGGLFLSELIEVIGPNGRILTPCKPDVAARQVRLHRARWVGTRRIRLRFDPFAYRYIRLKVLERDRYTCYWCGGPGLTIDHIIPWSKGGRTNMANCICACEKCNGERGDKPAEVFARERNVPAPSAGSAFEPVRLPAPKPVQRLESAPSQLPEPKRQGHLRIVAPTTLKKEPLTPSVKEEPQGKEATAASPAESVVNAVELCRTSALARLLDRNAAAPTWRNLR